MTFLVILLALAADYIFGEPKRFHPLVGFGSWADKLEKLLNSGQRSLLSGRITGMFAFILAVIPVVMLISCLAWLTPASWVWLIDAILLTFAIGHKSLREHALSVSRPLLKGDLLSARKAVGRIVSRDTQNLNQNEISKATIESILENGSDAIFAAIFWYVLAGAPGVVFYRLTNTLDAMWGYKTQRFNHFGWFAARTDDLLNYFPARLTAISYSVCGHFSSAIKCWHSQGGQWYSINAGPVMAAGAGALQVLLGGDSMYHGQIKSRAVLGCGQAAKTEDINRSLMLVAKSLFIWLFAIFLVDILIN